MCISTLYRTQYFMATNSLMILRDETEKDNRQICKLCLTQFSKYTCPRCNVQYCSLTCYKSEKHLQCSESFYEESFMAELQQRKGSSEEKQHMIDILKRLKEDNDGQGGGSEDSCIDSLEERLAGLDLDKDFESVWSRLTQTERKEFQKLLSSGKVGHLLEAYTPWWEVYSPVTETQSSSDGVHVEAPRRGSMPAVLTDLPPLNSLVKSGATSPFIRYSVINVLYAYCYIIRLFNGEHNELALQASQALMDIASCLSVNTAFSMVGEAVQHAVCSVQQNHGLFNSNEFSLSIMKDVSNILCHPKSRDCHVTHALSDVHNLLSKACKLIKSSSKGTQDQKAAKHQLWLAKKKVYFFTVWCHQHSDNLQPLAKLVILEYEMSKKQLMEDAKVEHKKAEIKNKGVESSHQGRTHKPIEEL